MGLTRTFKALIRMLFIRQSRGDTDYSVIKPREAFTYRLLGSILILVRRQIFYENSLCDIIVL